MDEDNPPENVAFRCFFCEKVVRRAVGFLERPGSELRPACQEHFEGRCPPDCLNTHARGLRRWTRVAYEDGRLRLWRSFCERAVEKVLES